MKTSWAPGWNTGSFKIKASLDNVVDKGVYFTPSLGNQCQLGNQINSLIQISAGSFQTAGFIRIQLLYFPYLSMPPGAVFFSVPCIDVFIRSLQIWTSSASFSTRCSPSWHSCPCSSTWRNASTSTRSCRPKRRVWSSGSMGQHLWDIQTHLSFY